MNLNQKISNSKIKKCLDSGEYQKECDKEFNWSLNHEMYLQQVKKLQYLHLMIKDVMKLFLKMYLGINTFKWF